MASKPSNATLPLDNYTPGIRGTPLRFPNSVVEPVTRFQKDVESWVNQYAKERFPAALRPQAVPLLRTMLNYYAETPEQPYLRGALKDTLNSRYGSANGALTVLKTLVLETRGQAGQANPLSFSKLSPLKTIEQVALGRMGREAFSDFGNLVLSLEKMSPNSTETLAQTKARVNVEKQVKKFAADMGQSNVTNIVISPRAAKDVIALTHQGSSQALSPRSFAADIAYDSVAGGVPIRSKLTIWFNSGLFARVGMPYVDSKGMERDPKTGGLKPATMQSVLRAGAFEMGMQAQVGLNSNPNQAKYLNTGFNIAVRGPHFKGVADFNPTTKKFSFAPSVNVSADMSSYVTLGIFRGGPYFELGRFAKDKGTHVLDKFDAGLNPDFIKDVMSGAFVD